MADFPRHITAIGIITLDLVPDATPRSPAPFSDELLIGAGLLTHQVCADGRLHLNLRTCVSKTWASDDTILSWLEDELALGEPLIGYELRDRLIPLLTTKAASDHFQTLNELPSVVDVRSFDLTGRSADHAPLTLTAACAVAQIPFPTWPWHLGQDGSLPRLTKALGRRCAIHAVTTWRLWVKRHCQALDRNGVLGEQLNDIDIWLAKSASHNLV